VAQKDSVRPTQRGRPKPQGDRFLAQLRQDDVLSERRRPRFEEQAAPAPQLPRVAVEYEAHQPDSVRLQARALEAALAAWKQAYKSPSAHGLPSVAGVNAYRSVLSERESVIRDRLRAALSRLRYCSERMN
jgi:hypothetical protein